VNQEREPLPTRVRDLPPMPAGDLAGLQADLAAGLAGLGLSGLAPDVRTRLIDHVRLLLAWNEAINLTAIRSPEAALREHVLDSLAAVPVLRGRALDALLDLGSGGGFPGIPLALVLPARRTLLVESVAKKAAFLTAAAGIVAGEPAGPAIEVYAGRSEALAADRRHRERWPAVVARAIAPLAELSELALPLVAPGGVLVAWKRRLVADEAGPAGLLSTELAAAGPALDRLGAGAVTIEPVPVVGLEDHVLVVIEKIASSPPGYPRDPARRRNRPIQPGDPLPSA
jgi:16S rRNA (guanine527-N7)-methyltransferase